MTMTMTLRITLAATTNPTLTMSPATTMTKILDREAPHLLLDPHPETVVHRQAPQEAPRQHHRLINRQTTNNKAGQIVQEELKEVDLRSNRVVPPPPTSALHCPAHRPACNSTTVLQCAT